MMQGEHTDDTVITLRTAGVGARKATVMLGRKASTALRVWGGRGEKKAGVRANGARGRASEARVLQEQGLTKNTTAVSTAKEHSIPKALTDLLSHELKVPCVLVELGRREKDKHETDANYIFIYSHFRVLIYFFTKN